MIKFEKDVFKDRRKQNRRCQDLDIPAKLNRRKSDRRCGTFSSRPWWLQVDYASEYDADNTDNTSIVTDVEPPPWKKSS